MKYPPQNLLDLLKASNRFLEDPESEEKWREFSKALEAVKRYESENAVRSSDEAKPQPEPTPPRRTLIDLLRKLDPASKRLLRQYYEKEVARPRYALVWGTLLVIIVVGALILAIAGRAFSPLVPLTGGETPTFTSTSTQIAKATLPVGRTTQIAAAPTPAPISTLTNGQITGTLTTIAPAVRYTFTGRAGDTIIITLSADDFDPYLILQDASDNELASNDDCGSLRRSCIESLQLPEDGDYSVIVDSYDRRSTGTYILSIPTAQSLVVTPLSADPAQCPEVSPRAVVVGNEDSINLRGGPGTGYPVITAAYLGECFKVVGRNSNSTWVQIRTLTGRRGWIVARLAEIDGELTSVPVMDE